ncbi:MAG TPA: flippase-like domain-containing protein [Deltaproteobacteria bacterium]|nr:flippase-like domain-containing protein [Deltaproteobacteria bacterium]
MSRRRKIMLSLIVGTAVSAVALYVTFSQIPLADLWDYLGTINYWWLIPSIVLGALSYVFRVIRWQVILLPVKQTSFANAYHPLIISFMMNSVLPARIGELARPTIFYKRERVEFSKVLATVGVERIFDMVTLLVLFILVLATVQIDPEVRLTFHDQVLDKATLETIWAGTLKAGILLIALIAAISIPRTRSMLERAIMKLPALFFFSGPTFREKIQERVSTRIVMVLRNLATGFEVVKNAKHLLSCFVLSFLVWGFAVLSFYVLSFGCPGIQVSLLEITAVFIIICFFIVLPSAPGFWGLFEAGGVYGLMLFGVQATEAAGLTLTFHVFSMVPLIIAGVISVVILGMNMRLVARETTPLT